MELSEVFYTVLLTTLCGFTYLFIFATIKGWTNGINTAYIILSRRNLNNWIWIYKTKNIFSEYILEWTTKKITILQTGIQK
jgi:hypothetical protein